MPFPNVSEKYGDAAVMEPGDVLEMRRRSGGVPAISPPSGVILCLKNDLPYTLRWRVPVQRVGRFTGDLFLLKTAKKKVGILSNFGVGAPTVVALAEELIAWGVQRFILLSWGGALQSGLIAGDIVIADKAIRDEGVSQHYLPPEMFAHSDPVLTGKLSSFLAKDGIGAATGATWTTDAPYRETRAEVLKYQSEGVMTVEMEAAGLFALGQVRNVQTAAVLVVADKLASLTWERPSDMQAINRSFVSAYRAAIYALGDDR